MATALVTGASRGIGREIALRLAERYDIVATSRTEPDLRSVADEIEDRGRSCRIIPLDLTDFGAVRSALDGIEVDVLVNNAGMGRLVPLLDLDDEDWHAMVDLNLNALYHVTKAVLPSMIRNRAGHVVFIGSIAGRSAFVGGAGYAATKWAVMGLSESLMLEVREHGVKVSVVNPGSVATGFSGRLDAPWSLAPEEVAEAVWHVVNTPPDVLIHRVEIRTANPKKTR